MEKPKYVLKMTNAQVYDKPGAKKGIPIAFGVIWVVIIVGSLLFGDNLFMELSFFPKLILISGTIGSIFTVKVGNKEDICCPVELWFYEDRMVIYHEKFFYKKGLYRKRYLTFPYVDMKKCEYYWNELHFTGKIHYLYYDYDMHGNVLSTPSKDYTSNREDDFEFIRTKFEKDESFLEIVQQYIPVTIERS